MKKSNDPLAFRLEKPARPITTENGDTITLPPEYSTTDYDRLEFHKSNRPVKPSHVKKMKESLLSNGMLRMVVVVQLGFRYFIVDGQHLYIALRQMGARVNFLLKQVHTELELFKIIAIMNSTQKGWTLRDFINGWAYFFNSYATLRRLREEYGLTDTAVAMVLGHMSKSCVKSSIKEGEFTAYDEAQAVRFIMAIDNFYSYLCPTGLVRYSYATEGFITYVNAKGLDNYLTIELDFLHKAADFNTSLGKNRLTKVAAKDCMENWLHGVENHTPKPTTENTKQWIEIVIK